jgi:ATP-binding cassette subfamily B protein
LALDRLTAPRGAVGGLALGLVATGLAAALLPVIARYGRAQIGRSASLVATERLFAASERQVGLRNFEDPAFLRRLMMSEGRSENAAKRRMDLREASVEGVLFSLALSVPC